MFRQKVTIFTAAEIVTYAGLEQFGYNLQHSMLPNCHFTNVGLVYTEMSDVL